MVNLIPSTLKLGTFQPRRVRVHVSIGLALDGEIALDEVTKMLVSFSIS